MIPPAELPISQNASPIVYESSPFSMKKLLATSSSCPSSVQSVVQSPSEGTEVVNGIIPLAKYKSVNSNLFLIIN